MTQTTATHHDYDDLTWDASGDGWKVANVTLQEGDSAWDPGSTRSRIYGPAQLFYKQAPDGGIDLEAHYYDDREDVKA